MDLTSYFNLTSFFMPGAPNAKSGAEKRAGRAGHRADDPVLDMGNRERKRDRSEECLLQNKSWPSAVPGLGTLFLPDRASTAWRPAPVAAPLQRVAYLAGAAGARHAAPGNIKVVWPLLARDLDDLHLSGNAPGPVKPNTSCAIE
jgi:hypothetical protein